MRWISRCSAAKSVLKGESDAHARTHRGGRRESSGILRLEKNCGFTLLCTWMTQFRLAVLQAASYLRLPKESDPIYTILNSRRAPRSFANEWIGDTFTFLGKSWFYPADDLSLTFLFSPIVNPTLCATCASRHNAIICGLYGRVRF